MDKFARHRGLQRVVKGNIHEREQAGVFRRRVVTRDGDSAGDIVPNEPNARRGIDISPELRHQSLLGGARRAGRRAYFFNFLEIGGVFRTRQIWRRIRRELSA